MLPFENPRPYTVTELSTLARKTLETSFASVRVVGEIGTYSVQPSGHHYFSLKDEGALIQCALFKGDAARLGFKPGQGMKVEAVGRLSLYLPRGSFQLIASALSPAGQGDLQQRFEELKKRLLQEGLFDDSRKRALPRFPSCVGVVTSPTGAVIHDIIRVARKRWPSTRIVLAPVRVQGEGAAEQIAGAVEMFGRHGAADVLIVGRGGGSLEDLWAFNEEVVVRAVAGSSIPVISAVGHETDVTLCDFAADLRAPTPSAAAERAVPDRVEYRERADSTRARALRAALGIIHRGRLSVDGLARSHALGRTRDYLQERMQRVDELRGRLLRGQVLALTHGRQRLVRGTGRLEALSPEQVMARGFCYVEFEKEREPVRDAASLRAGDGLRLVLRGGSARATVSSVERREGQS